MYSNGARSAHTHDRLRTSLHLRFKTVDPRGFRSVHRREEAVWLTHRLPVVVERQRSNILGCLAKLRHWTSMCCHGLKLCLVSSWNRYGKRGTRCDQSTHIDTQQHTYCHCTQQRLMRMHCHEASAVVIVLRCCVPERHRCCTGCACLQGPK